MRTTRCPHCGAEASVRMDVSAKVDGGRNGGMVWQVRCSCGVSGPLCVGRKNAVEAWRGLFQAL